MKKGFILVIVVICAAAALWGETTKDLEMWQAFGVSLKPAKGFKLYLEKELRYEDKLTNLDADLSEVGLRYTLSKLMAFRVNYRFVSLSGEKRNRIDGNVYLNFKLNNLTISNRTRLQQETIETHEEKETELAFRNRLRFQFIKSKKIRPFFGTELFVGLGEDGDKRNKLRLTVGTDWKVRKRVTLSLFYHFQRDLDKNDPDTSNIVGIKFNYSF
ncbi:MAG: DUF2490 domain-containing protein [bacterium]|nr:DUF2490 domain-containing protein [bacterium]